MKLGIPFKNIFISWKKEMLSSIKAGRMSMSGQVLWQHKVDGIRYLEILANNCFAEDRKLLSEDGIFVAVVN